VIGTEGLEEGEKGGGRLLLILESSYDDKNPENPCLLLFSMVQIFSPLTPYASLPVAVIP
jgi:hypothetical protein